MSTSRKIEVEFALGQHLQGLHRILKAYGFELGLVQRISYGAAGDGLVIHHQDVGAEAS